MTGAPWRSAFVAAVFAAHPLHVESVAWVAERNDVLGGLFFVLTIGAYVRHVRNPRSWLAVICRDGCFFRSGPSCPEADAGHASLRAPAAVITLAAEPVNALTARGKKQRFTTHPARLLLEKIPFLALSAAACRGFAYFAEGKAVATASMQMYSVSARVCQCAGFLRDLFAPDDLAGRTGDFLIPRPP